MFLRVNISYDSVVDHLGEHSLRIQVLGARNLRQKDTFLPQVIHLTRAFCPRPRPNMSGQPARGLTNQCTKWLQDPFFRLAMIPNRATAKTVIKSRVSWLGGNNPTFDASVWYELKVSAGLSEEEIEATVVHVEVWTPAFVSTLPRPTHHFPCNRRFGTRISSRRTTLSGRQRSHLAIYLIRGKSLSG